jgi:hypothetical protein
MTGPTARTVANVLLATAGVAAAYVVITTPPLRRLAATAVRVWLGASVPMYFLTQAGRAWQESGQASMRGSRAA